MTVEYIRKPAELGEPLGKYSHAAVGEGRLVAIAGQVGMHSDGRLAGEDMKAQTHKAYSNLGRALAAAGASFADILRMNTYLVGEEQIPMFMAARNEVFQEIFPTGDYPPNTLLVVSRLVEPGLLMEVDALAVVRPSQ